MPDPFGLKAGSTPPAGMANYMVAFYAVPNPHPAFQTYNGAWTPEMGLTRIIATSRSVAGQADCSTSRALYERVKRQLVQVYGNPADVEIIDPDATWPDEKDFWQSLQSGERNHGSRWSLNEGNALDAGIEQIDLMVTNDDEYDVSHVILAYQFEGFQAPEPADEYGVDSL
jgi:hypothetical protein